MGIGGDWCNWIGLGATWCNRIWIGDGLAMVPGCVRGVCGVVIYGLGWEYLVGWGGEWKG